MDLATLIGLIVGLVLIVGSMAMGTGIGPFINPPGLIIVVGGAFCGTLVRFPIGECFRAFGTATKTAFKYSAVDPYELIETVKVMADTARKKGMLALEDAEVPDPLLGKGIQMCVDGHDADFIKDLLGKEITTSIKRAEMGEKVFRAMGDAAPAFGMIGTLAGLVALALLARRPDSFAAAADHARDVRDPAGRLVRHRVRRRAGRRQPIVEIVCTEHSRQLAPQTSCHPVPYDI